MKILYIDIILNGHHMPYLKALLNDPDNTEEKVLLIPESDEDFGVKTYTYKNDYDHRKIVDYCKWIFEVKKVITKENPDAIHLLYGDILYRHFGFLLGFLKKYRTYVTFHQFRRKKLVDISLKLIFRKISYGVVHTEFLSRELAKIPLKNVYHIEYPQLYEFDSISKTEACKSLGLDPEIPVLGILGQTRFYKGFDIMLEAMKNVRGNYQLLIAGKEGYFSKEYIKKHTESYKDKVHTILRFLSDEELCTAISACDYVVLPYRKRFDGASGPLTEAAWARRNVISANHGSLGDIVAKNDLGYLFESENVEELTKTIETAIQNRKEWSEKAEEYRKIISKEVFRKEYRDLYEK